MALWRTPIPTGRSLSGAALYGALNFGLGYGIGYYGLVDVPAGTGAVLLATVPLFTVFLASAQRLERLSWRALLGALIGLAGIAVVFREQLSAAIPAFSILSLLGSAAVAAESGVIAKQLPRMHPVATNAIGMLVGGVMLLAASAALDEPRAIPEPIETWIALAYLAVIGSVGLFGGYLFMLSRWTATASSYSIVVMPLVAVLLGALMRGELVTAVFIAGGLLVAAGVYVGALTDRAS